MSEFGFPFWDPFWDTFWGHFRVPFWRPLWSLGNPVGRVWDSRGTPFWGQMVDPPKNGSWTTFSSQNRNFDGEKLKSKSHAGKISNPE